MKSNQLQTDLVLDLLQATPNRLAALAHGLPDSVLKQRPGVDAWSATDILAHLRACADVWGKSILTMIAEDAPKLRYLSPRTWVRKTDYDRLDFQSSLSAFTHQRLELLKVLSRLPRKDWSRSATFSGTTKGRHQTVYSYATRMAEHEDSHCKQTEAVLKKVSIVADH